MAKKTPQQLKDDAYRAAFEQFRDAVEAVNAAFDAADKVNDVNPAPDLVIARRDASQFTTTIVNICNAAAPKPMVMPSMVLPAGQVLMTQEDADELARLRAQQT